MKFHFDVLSKKAREEWVTVLAEENSENSDMVRVKFREIPEAEFSVLEATFAGAVGAVGRLAREITGYETKIHQERTTTGAAQVKTLSELKLLIAGYREAKAELQALRREIVGKTIVDHDPEFFELDHLPFEGDELAEEARATLLSLGFGIAEIEQAFRDGFIRTPFEASSWVYGEGQQAKTLVCASEETIRRYERLRPDAQLLNSLCNAVFSWHRLALKPAAQKKEDLREARLKRTRQAEKAMVFVKNNLVGEHRLSALINLPAEVFQLLTDVLLESVQLQLGRGSRAVEELPPVPPYKG